MPAEIISGRKIAEEMRAAMGEEIDELKDGGVAPGLGVILVGENPASKVYVRMKSKACDKVGINSITNKMDRKSSEEEVLQAVEEMNQDKDIHGILVQLPLPDQVNENKVLEAIDPTKDVDGFHPENMGRLMAGKPRFIPCTPYGVQKMLLKSGNDPHGKDVVIVGRSSIVGKPLANILYQKSKGANATVTVCHSRTEDLASHTRRADILIAAVGVPEMITADMVSEGVVVIDVGVNRVDDPESEKGYKLVGDVAFDEVKEKAKAISPVPGGVGPMTITMLLNNTLQAAKITI